MENTANVLFPDDVPQWYVAQGDRWVGPLTAADIYQKVVNGELTWAHFVWKPGQADWRRICDVKTFQAAVPNLPARDVQQQVKEAAKPVIRQAPSRAGSPPPAPSRKAAPPAAPVEPRIWFLFYNDSQFGPFSAEEVKRYLATGKIHGRVFGWCDGMQDWARLEGIEAFRAAVAAQKSLAAPTAPSQGQKSAPEVAAAEARVAGAAKSAAAASSGPSMPSTEDAEHRTTPRRPLVAKIVMAHDDAVHVAVCRDISVGGMQVLTDKIPGTVGKRIKMNVSATGLIKPFVAEGEIVRILEDRRGFSFRFERLSEEARQSIESYIRGGA